jgi:hypothetical protein
MLKKSSARWWRAGKPSKITDPRAEGGGSATKFCARGARKIRRRVPWGVCHSALYVFLFVLLIELGGLELDTPF